jgi:hypothetical protein
MLVRGLEVLSIVLALPFFAIGIGLFFLAGFPSNANQAMAGLYPLLSVPICLLSLKSLKASVYLYVVYFLFRWAWFITLTWPSLRASNPITSFPEYSLSLSLISLLAAYAISREWRKHSNSAA